MKYETGKGRTALCYDIHCCGPDLLIHISGGGDHLGAVSGAAGGSVTTQVFPGHEEKWLTEPLAKALSAEFPGNVVVSAGVHLDQIRKEEIAAILAANAAAVGSIIALLEQEEWEAHED